jgi:hypothetical protein
MKTIILPRQARDRHRESTQKILPFSSQHFRFAFGFGGKDPSAAAAASTSGDGGNAAAGEGGEEEEGYLGGVMRSPAKLLSGISKRIW